MTKRRLVVAGGGGAEDSAPLDEGFSDWIGPTDKLLYLPIAMDGQDPSYEMCLQWLRGVFAPFHVYDIEMWTDLACRQREELARFKAIYIGGGNTYRLLHLVRTSGFDATLVQFAERGGILYGGSAGAILLGRDISTCADTDRNSVGLQDTTGLDLINGYAVWCHYRPKDEAKVVNYAREHDLAVLALSERSGICLENDRLLSVGFEGVHKFVGNSYQYIKVGRAFD